MYRALYAHNSKLPKYLSFEAGDKFTLVDTSKSDQWFLAQNGLGEIGFVPFNYIKKIEASTEQQVKFIDGAMEAIHLQATNAGGQYTHDQRLVMKKLVKHRSDVIKNASAAESKSANRRRPAPAPPVERNISLDSAEGTKASSLVVIGRRATLPSFSESQKVSDNAKDYSNDKKKSSPKHKVVSPSKTRSTSSSDPRRSSALSETARKEVTSEESIRKSKSVTSSIGQAPSLVSSYSSNTSDLTCTDSLADASNLSDEGISAAENLSTGGCENNQPKEGLPESDYPVPAEVEDHFDVSDPNIRESYACHMDEQITEMESADNIHESHANVYRKGMGDSFDQMDIPPPPAEYSNNDESHGSTTSSASGLNDHDLPSDDLLPPPPPEVYADIDDDHFEVIDTLPPAPPEQEDITSGEELKMDEFYVSLNSDILEICGRNPMEECCCEDFQPKFDSTEKFYAHNSLKLPPQRNVKVIKKEIHEPKQVSHVFSSLLKPQEDPDKVNKQHELLELAQAYCVQVTHADCEEMIGEFRKATNLSHEESHWAILTVMNLLAAKVPHIKPSLEVVGMRLHAAHECRSTGLDYQCEDTLTLHRLISELEAVTGDAQQRGHYLRDDLDSIIDIITGLSDTLSNSKLCVSMAAIHRDNFNMVEVIAKYYQMETRWVIHSCMLHLIEIICRLNPLAIQEFLYSELPQEMVAEMQQHHNDDARLLQVAKTLGIVFVKGLPSPHKLGLTMDIPFFIWLLGMIENMAELNRLSDVDIMLALLCAYHLQHEDNSQNPLTEALKMAHGHALLESALRFLSKHDDPTKLLGSNIEPKLNSVILLLSHLFDNPDTADLLYTNDVEVLIGIFEEFLRDLTRDDPLRKQILQLLENFMRNYPDTVSLRGSLSKKLGPLLLNIREENNKCGETATQILDDNGIIFDDI